MRIVVDINHPAHVHYFKNFIWEMKRKGHEILITASEKDISYKLLDNYRFDYIKLGTYGKSLTEKLVNIPILDLRMYNAVRGFKPDIFLGFGSIRAAHVSSVLGKPCIALDDTEHAKFEHMLYVPFTDVILTPSCFQKDFGKKQIRYNGYTELTYLYPNYFVPDPGVLDEMKLSQYEPFFIMRFVSWNASHDLGHKGINLEMKLKIAKNLEKYGRVLISSETSLPKDFDKYKIIVPPEKMHDLLYYATLLFGESATMASECAILGTPAIYLDFTGRGYTDEEESRYGLVYNFKNCRENQEAALTKALELIQQDDIKKKCQLKSRILIEEKIDVTKFLIEFFENYFIMKYL